MVGGEGFDEGFEFTFHDEGEVVGGETDPVIGEAILREVIGADLFVAFACADLFAAGGVDAALLFGPFFFEKAGRENFHGVGAIFNLRAAVLAADDEACGDVHDLDGGIGGVDALAPWATGAADFDADFVGPNMEFHLFGFGEDGDGGGGGMDAALGFGGGNALDAVDSALLAHGGEDGGAAEFKDNFFETAEFGLASGEGFHFPSPHFGVAGVHAVKVSCEDGGFGSSCARTNFDEGIAMFVGVGGENGSKDGFAGGCLFAGEFGVFVDGELAEFGIGGGGAEGFIFLAAGEEGNEAAGGFGAGADARMFSGEIAGAGGLAVEARLRHFTIQFLKAVFEKSELGGGFHKGKGGTPPVPLGNGQVNPRGRLGALFGLGCGGGGVETAAEFLHATCGIDEFLGASEEGVAGGADTQADLGFGGAGMVDGPTGAGHGAIDVGRMDFGFHRTSNQTRREAMRQALCPPNPKELFMTV